jgi:hypothetical protein
MSISLAQPTSVGSGVTSKAFGSNVTAGNLLVAMFWTSSPGTVVSIPTDSRGNVWTQCVPRNFYAGTGGTEIWWAKASSSGSCTITINLSGGATVAGVSLREYASTQGWPSNPFDVKATGTGSSTLASSGAVTSHGNGVIVAAGGTGGGTVSAGSGFGDYDNPAGYGCYEDKLNVAAGSVSATFGISSQNTWNISMAVFIENSGTTYNDSLTFGLTGGTGDTGSATQSAAVALGSFGTAGDAPAATIPGAAQLGVQGGSAMATAAVIAQAIAAGILDAIAAAQSGGGASVYNNTIGLGASAAETSGVALGSSLAAAFGEALAAQSLVTLSSIAAVGLRIGGSLASTGVISFRDSVALGAFARALAVTLADVLIGRVLISDGPAFTASSSDKLAAVAIAGDALAGKASANDYV